MPQQQDCRVERAERIRFDFEFTDDDFHRIRGLILSHAGIHLGHNKRAMVYSRLGRRLRKLHIASFSEYLDRMESGTGAELAAFINSLTTNLTYFYREMHHFSVLREFLQEGGLPWDSTIWSAGCSTGEEAYSIAMVLATVPGSRSQVGQIVASDIDTSVLEHAERGIYPAASTKNIPSADLKRFFLGCGGKRRVRQGAAGIEPARRLSPDQSARNRLGRARAGAGDLLPERDDLLQRAGEAADPRALRRARHGSPVVVARHSCCRIVMKIRDISRSLRHPPQTIGVLLLLLHGCLLHQPHVDPGHQLLDVHQDQHALVDGAQPGDVFGVECG